MIPDSASGASLTRTPPPSLPTSSPMTRTFGSRSIAARRPSFSAFAIVRTAMSAPTSDRRRSVGLERLVVGEVLLPLSVDRGRTLRVDLREHPVWCRRGHVHAVLTEPRRQCVRLGLHTGEELLPDAVLAHPGDP